MKWIVDALSEWDMTFEEDTKIPDLIKKIEKEQDLSADDVEFFIFHLWQMAHGDELTID